MTLNRNLLSEAVRYSLTAGAVGLLSLASAPAFAQDTTTAAPASSDTKTLDKIEVTGSRIKRVDQEGPEPITIIKRADLEVSGNLSVADVLRSTTFNSFGSFQQTSGSTAQSQSTISLRGLGSQYTLILLDGRRIAGSPVLGAASQNLNSIPFAAVDRIEILRDGASAIYGSDAIGGVINVILRKDYQGLNVTAQTERSQFGEPAANTASITGGISSDRGNVTFVVDHQERSIFFNRDRHGPAGADPGVGLSAFGSPGSAYLYTTADGSFGGSSVLRPDPRCPTALNSDPLFPNSTNTPPGGSQSAYFCYFNYAATNANEASLSRESILVNGNFDLTDNISAFARIVANEGSSFGRFAPVPITNPRPTMSGADPRNPFGVDIKLLFRNVPGGPRDNTVRDNVFDVLFGFKGHSDWFGGSDWEVAAHHNHTLVQDTGNGYLLRTAFQNAVDSGLCNPFADPNDQANIAGCQTANFTTNHHATSRLEGIDGNIGFDLFDIGDRSVNFVTGYEWERDYYSDQVDAQTAAGNVSGTAGGNASGQRTRYAVYVEAKFPVLANLNIDVAGRYDSYSDFGSTTNPAVSFEYRPLDNLLLRASWSEGFRAPGLSNLYQQQIQSFNTAIDVRRRDAQGCTNPATPAVDLDDALHGVTSPGNPCRATQFENVSGGNPNLQPETSRNWSAGVVWNAMDRLSFSLDYYNIKLRGQIGSLTVQTLLNDENDPQDVHGNCTTLQCSPFVVRNPNGTVFIINAIQQNLNSTETTGFDFDAKYGFDTDWGTFNQELTYSRVTKFNTVFGDGSEQHLDADVAAGIPGTSYAPKQRAQLVLDWKKGDFFAAIQGDMIGKVHNGDGSRDIGTWTTWDVQAGWKTPWDGKVTMGIRNVGGRNPPLDSSFGTPFYNNSLYNWLGRVPYLRYSQDF